MWGLGAKPSSSEEEPLLSSAKASCPPFLEAASSKKHIQVILHLLVFNKLWNSDSI